MVWLFKECLTQRPFQCSRISELAKFCCMWPVEMLQSEGKKIVKNEPKVKKKFWINLEHFLTFFQMISTSFQVHFLKYFLKLFSQNLLGHPVDIDFCKFFKGIFSTDYFTNGYLTVLTCFFAPQCHFSIPINQTQKMFRNTFSHSFLRHDALANLAAPS